MTILIVEDDPNDEHFTLRALRQCGVPCTVVVVHDGREALDFLNRRGAFDGRTCTDPRAIFVDNTLPGFGGAELIHAIRQIPDFVLVPIVVFSGSMDLAVVDRCSKAGANSFLEKPMEVTEYIEQVSRAAKYWLTLNQAPGSFADRASAM